MKALVVPQPIANDVMLGQQALLAFPYEPAADVVEFLMVSGDEPLPDEYTLGLALGYQLGVVTINRVTPSTDVPGFFEWEVAPKMLVAPKAMHLEPDTFTPVAETDIPRWKLKQLACLLGWLNHTQHLVQHYKRMQMPWWPLARNKCQLNIVRFWHKRGHGRKLMRRGKMRSLNTEMPICWRTVFQSWISAINMQNCLN